MEQRSGLADDGHARAARATQAEQASRKYLGFVAQIGIAQHRVQFTATVIEVVARFSLGGILERFDKIAESFEPNGERSEEHTSELQSLMRISYAVFCLKKKNNKTSTMYKH